MLLVAFPHLLRALFKVIACQAICLPVLHVDSPLPSEAHRHIFLITEVQPARYSSLRSGTLWHETLLLTSFGLLYYGIPPTMPRYGAARMHGTKPPSLLRGVYAEAY